MSKRKKSEGTGLTDAQKAMLRDHAHTVMVTLDGPSYMTAVMLEAFATGKHMPDDHPWEHFDPVRYDMMVGECLKRLLHERLEDMEESARLRREKAEVDAMVREQAKPKERRQKPKPK